MKTTEPELNGIWDAQLRRFRIQLDTKRVTVHCVCLLTREAVFLNLNFVYIVTRLHMP
jgi:hypothetical protein